jgi:D-lactate dehydrogenase
MRIAIFDTEDYEIDFLKKSLKGLDVGFYKESLDEASIQKAEDYDIVSVFIASTLNAKVLARLPKLKFITARSTGFDHIDCAFCDQKKILVSNVPYYGDNTVAEHTFALLLALSKKIVDGYDQTRRGMFDFHGLMGFDLADKTIGIIGMGRIGQHVAKIATGFGMKILAYDVKKDDKLAEDLNFRYMKLDDLLSSSDVITLHAPYNEHTHHMLNMDNIKKIKKGSVLINTARGGLVETEALVWALDSGRLSGAGLDVLEQEENIKEETELLKKNYTASALRTVIENHILVERKNVIVTPHIAFNTKEGVTRILETTSDNIKAYIKGKPINLVK